MPLPTWLFRKSLIQVSRLQLAELADRVRVCTECPLCRTRITAVPGEGRSDAEFMMIGEAPGRHEDETGLPFRGMAGRNLNRMLAEFGLERADFFITSVVKCRPPANRIPRPIEIQACTSLYLFRQIELINPKLIVLLGGVATRTLLGLEPLERARGRIIEYQGRNFLATYHPVVTFRPDWMAKMREDFGLLRLTVDKLSQRKAIGALPHPGILPKERG